MKRGKNGIALLEIWRMAFRGAVDLEEFHQVVLFLTTTDSFNVEDLAEVGVALVGDVD